MFSFPLPLWLATLQVVATPTTWVPKWTALPLTCVNLRGNQHSLGGLSRLNQCLAGLGGVWWRHPLHGRDRPGGGQSQTNPPGADC